MKPRNIYLIRHGESASNADKTVHAHTPDWQIPLTNKGCLQAIHAANILHGKIGHGSLGVYVSPLLRTRQTWNSMHVLFNERDWIGSFENLPSSIKFIKEDPRLREQEWGHLRSAEVTDSIDKERQKYGTYFYRLPDGESGADVEDRCSGFLDTLHRDFEKPDFPDNVLIVTHGFTLRIFLKRWFHWSTEDFHQLQNPRNCEIFHMEKNLDNRYKLVTLMNKRKEIL